jgi:methionyl-tRNA formyltransferase
MGSPEFAVPTLDALVESRAEIPLVVTQPDRRAGRGRQLEATAVKDAARGHGLPVVEWGTGDAARVTQLVRDAAPDAVVVTAFGHILRQPLLDAPRLGCLNLHASLLPRWRGVAPVHYAIMHGDAWSGVSIMRMDAGVDTGPVLAQHAVAIEPEETAGDLLDRLAGLGADLLVRTLRTLETGAAQQMQFAGTPQNETGAVYAPKLNRSLSPLRWERSAVKVHNQVRGLQPWPGATTYLDDRQIKITGARPWSFHTSGDEPGTVLAVVDEGLCVACGEGVLLVTGLQNTGKKPMTAAEFLRGCPIPVGARLRS